MLFMPLYDYFDIDYYAFLFDATAFLLQRRVYFDIIAPRLPLIFATPLLFATLSMLLILMLLLITLLSSSPRDAAIMMPCRFFHFATPDFHYLLPPMPPPSRYALIR